MILEKPPKNKPGHRKNNLGAKTCPDKGCMRQGGFCVDMKKVSLKSKNSFPRNSVNLDKRIEGDLCAKDQEGCCQCYKRLED